ncbi:TadE/TadG family type IV pilus assembly protein [Vibrio sp. DNB22_10_4]|jgi:tight adherence protein E
MCVCIYRREIKPPTSVLSKQRRKVSVAIGCQSKRRIKGVTTIEFAIGAVALILTTLLIFEASYRIYVTNLVEYALRETVRSTNVFEGGSVHDNYKTQLGNLIAGEGKVWHYLVSEENFRLTGKYFGSYQDFVNNAGYSDQDDDFTEGYTLAEITLSYDYTPFVNVTGSDGGTIERTTVLNLEHEGWGE